MNKRIDLSNIGGFPLEEDTLQFMQESYRGALGAIAKLCGNKTILHGVETVGSNITSGWISVDGELMRFVGAASAAQVVITETPAVTQAVFEDGSVRNVYFTKQATVGAVGSFNFSELIKLDSLATIMSRLAAMKGIVSYAATDVYVGDIVSDKFINISIPDQGTSDYIVSGSLVGYSSNPDTDNDVAWMVSAKTNTGFTLCVKDINAPVNVQNLKFDFTITKKL